MSIKQNGGVFGRNPTFNDVTIEGNLIINDEVFTGLDFQGSWNASTNSPALASSVGTNGEFYIVSVAGTTDLNGITNWGIGDWAIFNGTVWQRVEGGSDGNFDDLTANSLIVNGNATVDGLTVDGAVDINTGADGTVIASLSGNSAGRKLDIQSFAVGASVGAGYSINATSGQGEIDLQTGGKSRLNIGAGGDVSLYEDTGGTAKFHWDSSGESLGIGSTPNAAAILDVQSTTKGVRFPNMTTTQKNAMADVAGMQVYDTTLNKMCFNTGSAWETITSS